MTYNANVDKEVKAGDKIRITKAMDSHGKYETGDILTVKEVLSASRVMAEEHDRVIHFMEFEVVKQEEGIRVGSSIRIGNPEESGGYYKKGDVLTVSRIHRGTSSPYVLVEEFDRPIHFYEFHLLNAKNPKVGDKIRITHATFPAGKYKNGDILTVSDTSFDPEGVIKWVYVEGLDCFPILRQEFEVLSEESLWTPVNDERGDKLKELDSRLAKVETEISAHASQISQSVKRHEDETAERDIQAEIEDIEDYFARKYPDAVVRVQVTLEMEGRGSRNWF